MPGLNFFAGNGGVRPPLPFEVSASVEDDPAMIVAEPADESPQSISGFVSIIDYDGELRLITGRRYDLIGEKAYVGAICHTASGYRQFRCDRIANVFDAYSGEALGDGGYFARFQVDGRRERAPTWGLTSGRKHLLTSGLNILAFMARCDGRWHLLEGEAIERFVCSMWLKKEWPGDPPIDEIVAHANRLAPDSSLFFKSLSRFAASESNTRIIKAAVADLIEADGIICRDEVNWVQELEYTLEGVATEADEQFLQMLREQGVLEE